MYLNWYLNSLIGSWLMAQNVFLPQGNLHEVFQSTYKQFHSPETALLGFENDLFKSVDSDGGAITSLLELSVAFDTIDRDVLLQRLHDPGIQDSNFLDLNRIWQIHQCAYIKGQHSHEHRLPFGVPRGFVFRPILFTIVQVYALQLPEQMAWNV